MKDAAEQLYAVIRDMVTEVYHSNKAALPR